MLAWWWILSKHLKYSKFNEELQNKHEPRCCVGHTFSSAAILLLRFSVLLTDCEQVLELWMSSGLPRNFSFCFKFFMIYSRMRKKHRSPEVGAEITSIFTTVGLWMFRVYSLMSGWCCASSLDSKSVCSLRVGLSASDTNADVWWGDTVHYTDAGPETTGLCCPFRLWWFENRLPAPELWSKPNMQRSTVVYRCVCVFSCFLHSFRRGIFHRLQEIPTVFWLNVIPTTRHHFKARLRSRRRPVWVPHDSEGLPGASVFLGSCWTKY